MLYIRTLLSPRSRSTQEAQVSSLLNKTGVTGAGELKKESNQLLITSLTSSLAPHKLMQALLAKTEELSTADELAKLLTLIHGTVVLMDYEGEIMEELAGLQVVQEVRIKGEGSSWFLPLYKAYVSYLVKLPSVSEVYLRARGGFEKVIT